MFHVMILFMDTKETQGLFSRITDVLVSIGLGESLLRTGTTLITVALLGVVAWLVQSFYAGGVRAPQNAVEIEPTSAVVRVADVAQAVDAFAGIPRLAQVYTIIPNRPRQEVLEYTVVEGDSLFGIGEKFGLKPETILWGNYSVLYDDPHSLKPGQVLKILPVDGTYHEWQQGEGLNAIAEFYGVKPDDIVNYPANNLDLSTIGDYANPNIAPGTKLIVPNGRRDFIAWTAPFGITRENPASARVMGDGSCGEITGGAVGYGTFVWPANNHSLSGFDYSPSTNHWGIDIAGNEGEGTYATDAGVVVYAGWNDYGYGNMIMIDHGNNFQSLYAHLSGISVVCGQSVGQGDLIGLIGNTGRSSGSHLHFEIRAISSWVNPWDVLP